MKAQTYTQVWQSLSADEKQDLAVRTDCSYDYLKCIACRRGRCGRHLAQIITTELIDMDRLDGPMPEQFLALFPRLASSNKRPAARVQENAVQASGAA